MIYAVGECAEHRGKTYGLVAPLWDMARVCAAHLAADAPAAARFVAPPLATKLKVTGVDLFSAGNFAGGEDYGDSYGGNSDFGAAAPRQQQRPAPASFDTDLDDDVPF